jgi:glycosyltransferase involved in cell wall biosynthesis
MKRMDVPMADTIIVVPCHNEAQRLNLDVFRSFARGHRDIKFLLVNDGSQDRTQSMLEQLAYSNPLQFDVLNLAENGGKAEAVRRGVLKAASSSPLNIGYWDADLATPLEAIPDFLAVLDRRRNIDLVMGVRLPMLGHRIRRRAIRRWLGMLFARVTALVLGLRTQDTQCGAKMFRANAEMLSLFSQSFRSRWIFDVELLARWIRLRRDVRGIGIESAIYELPLETWEDVKGSKLKRGDFIKAISELASIWWRYLRPAAPALSTFARPETTSELADASTEQTRRAA